MSYIYDEVSANDMIDRAIDFGRYDQLGGIWGIEALHEWLTDLAEDIGEPIELDIIALCCEWSHYTDIVAAAAEYLSPDELDELHTDDLPGWFRDRTTVLELDNGAGYLIQAF